MPKFAVMRLDAYKKQIVKYKGKNLRMAREYFKYYKSIPCVRNDRDRLIQEALRIFYENGGEKTYETANYLVTE